MTLGEKLQQLRRERGISQEQLAAYINVSRQAVSKWELNESMPDTSNVIQLSGLFNVTSDFFLFEDAPRNATIPVSQHSPTSYSDSSASRISSDIKLRGHIDGWDALSMCMACAGSFVMLLSFCCSPSGLVLMSGAIIDAIGLAFFSKQQRDKHHLWNWRKFIFGQLALPPVMSFVIMTFAVPFIVNSSLTILDYFCWQDIAMSSVIHFIIGCGISFLMHIMHKPSAPYHEDETHSSPAESPRGYVKLQ